MMVAYPNVHPLYSNTNISITLLNRGVMAKAICENPYIAEFGKYFYVTGGRLTNIAIFISEHDCLPVERAFND